MLSERQKEKLTNLLEANEKVLWADNPAPGFHLAPYFFGNLFLGSISTAIGVGNIVASIVNAEEATLSSILFIPFACVGVYILATSLTIPCLSRFTVYAVTNRRIIFMYPFKNYLLPIRDLPKVDMEEKRGGVGHIFFVERVRYKRGRKGRYQDITTDGCVFINIENVQKVRELITSQHSVC